MSLHLLLLLLEHSYYSNKDIFPTPKIRPCKIMSLLETVKKNRIVLIFEKPLKVYNLHHSKVDIFLWFTLSLLFPHFIKHKILESLESDSFYYFCDMYKNAQY